MSVHVMMLMLAWVGAGRVASEVQGCGWVRVCAGESARVKIRQMAAGGVVAVAVRRWTRGTRSACYTKASCDCPARVAVDSATAWLINN